MVMDMIVLYNVYIVLRGNATLIASLAVHKCFKITSNIV